MKKKGLFFIVLIMLLLFCFPQKVFAEESNLQTIRLQLRWDHQFQFAGYYAADWMGYYKEEGLKVDIISAFKSDGTILSSTKEVSEGRADFGIGAADILIANDNGADLRVTAVILQQSAARYYLKEETPFTKIPDLTKLRVARNVNDLIDVELQAMLINEGIDPKTVKAYPHQAGMDHLISDKVQVMPGYELSVPFNAKVQGIAIKEINPLNYGVDFYGDSLFVSGTLADKNPELVAKFVRASLKGWEYALNNSDEIAARISSELIITQKIDDFYGFNLYQAKTLKELTQYPIIEIGHINPYRWEKMHGFLKQIGLVKNDINISKFIFDPVKLQTEKDKKIKYFAIWSAVGLFGLIVLILLWVYFLKKTARLRTREIKNKERFLIESKKAEEEIKSLAKFPEENPNLVARIDYTEKLLYCNHAYKRIFNDNDTFPDKLQAAVKKIASEKIPAIEEVEIEVGDRTFLFNLVSIKKERYINFYGNDITARKQAELNAIEQMKELLINKALLNNVGEIAHVGGWTFNTKTLTQTWTDETFRILEIDLTKGEPKVPEGLDFIVPAFRPMAEQAVQKAVEFGEPYDQEWEVITAKGNRRWVHSVAKVVQGQDKIKTIIGSFQDITERKNKETQILHISFHDHLTELYNRRFFEEEIKRLDTVRQLPLSIIMADLNGLKIVNDAFGHNEGDKLLIEVAKILKKICRSDDILARWGGDEFVIILPKTTSKTADDIVQRIKKECAKTSGQKIPLSLAIGVAAKTDKSQGMQLILIDAESNMYKNKLIEKESNGSSIISALEQILYEKSNETKEHTDRIGDLAIKLGKEVNLSSKQLDELSLLATLHDIGKVAIPETILLKEGSLTEKEWEVIKRHPEIGFNIANSSPQIAHIAQAILCCHENWGGSGYPQGLKGKSIPVTSRIVLIVDAYDVMTNKRVYKTAISKENAIKELKRCAGTQFDPVLVDKFVEILDRKHYR